MKKNGKKVFRPCKIPRYLIGSAKLQTIYVDLAEYNAHRYKVFTAKCRVDSKPPKLNPYNYINIRKLRNDLVRVKHIDMENRQLVKRISIINRTIGIVDSYNPAAYAVKSRWDRHVQRMKAIESKNQAIYQKIILANSAYNCASLREHWKEIKKKLAMSARYALVILKKEPADEVVAKLPSISCGLDKLAERPLCFLEFKIVDGPVIGRVEIELYHDHVPVTVQNFLSICSGDNKMNLSYKNCPVHRIVRGRFLETGDITKGTGKGGKSIYGNYFSEENHRLKHTKAGVLSMVRIRKHDNNSKFCITFGNMESLDRQHVVFGKIIRGIDNLFKVEGYGRRIGKPLLPIIISNCGQLNLPPNN